MSSSSNSSSSSLESEYEETHNEEIVESVGFVPYDEDLEPLATEQEAAEQDARMAQEADLRKEYQKRFTREVAVDAWYV